MARGAECKYLKLKILQYCLCGPRYNRADRRCLIDVDSVNSDSDSDDTDTVDRLVTEAVGRIIKRGLITFCDTLNNFPKD